jgi:hypothetical protein
VLFGNFHEHREPKGAQRFVVERSSRCGCDR